MGRIGGNMTTATTGTGRLSGSTSLGDYRAKTLYDNTISKIKAFDTLSTHDQYNTLREAREQGIIDKNTQLNAIKQVGQNAQFKIQEAGKPKGIAENIVNFANQSIVQPVTGAFKQFGGSMGATAYEAKRQITGEAKADVSRLSTAKMEFLKATTVANSMINGPYSNETKKKALDAANALYKNYQAIEKGQRAYTKEYTEAADTIKTLGSAITIGSTAIGAMTAGAPALGKVIGSLGSTAGRQVAGRITGGALQGGLEGALGNIGVQLNETGSNTTGEQLKQAAGSGFAVGGIIGGGASSIGETASSILNKSASKRLMELKTTGANATENLLPEVDASKFTTKKVNIEGGGETTNIGVKTLNQMSDKEYTRQFNNISKSYDKSMKSTENMLPAKQKIMQQSIESRHTEMLKNLDDAYNNPKMETITPKKVTTTKTALETSLNNITPQEKVLLNTTPSKNRNITVSNSKTGEKYLYKPKTDEEYLSLRRQIDGGNGKSGIDGIPDKNGNVVHVTASDETRYINQGYKKVDSIPYEGLNEPTIATTINGVQEFTTKGTSKTVGTTPKVSGSAAKLNSDIIEKNMETDSPDIATYGSGSTKTEISKMTELADNDPQRLNDIAMGKIRGDNSIQENVAYNVAVQKAMQDGDIDALAKLKTSKIHTKISESAQRMQVQSYFSDSTNPLTHIESIEKARLDSIKKNSNIKINAEVNKANNLVNKATVAPKKSEWYKLIEELRCK